MKIHMLLLALAVVVVPLVLPLAKKFHWFIVALMAVALPLSMYATGMRVPGEFYPFSHFPMYSIIEPDTYYVYVQGDNGKLLSAEQYFGRSMTEIKKTYNTHLNEQQKRAKEQGKSYEKRKLPAPMKAEAAKATLNWLLRVIPLRARDEIKTLGTLHLHEVQIEYRDGRIETCDTLVGEQPVAFPP